MLLQSLNLKKNHENKYNIHARTELQIYKISI